MKHFIENLKAKLNGSKDGKINIPEDYKGRSPYLRRIKEEGSSAINTINQAWQKADVALKTKWLNSMEGEYNAKNKLYESEEHYEDANNEYFSHNLAEKAIPKNLRFKFTIYYLTLGFFVFADMYLTIVAIRIFGEAEIFNIIFGFVLGTILSVFCHKFGESLGSKGKIYNKYFQIIGISLVVMVAVAVGILRGLYLSHSHFLNFAAIMYSILNLFFLYGGLLYSYGIHQPGYHKLFVSEKSKKQAEKKLSNAMKYRLNTVTKREKSYNYFKSFALKVINRVNHLMHIYWSINIRKRTSVIDESYSPDPILFVLPKELENIEWKTPQEFSNYTNNNNNNNKTNHNGEYYESNGHSKTINFVNYNA